MGFAGHGRCACEGVTTLEGEIAMHTFVMFALIALLTACTTQAERTARVQREVDEMIATYGPACEKLGYRRDAEPWRDCVLRLSAKDTAERYSRTPTTTSCFGHRGFFQCSTF
jgi:hypothetical protein